MNVEHAATIVGASSPHPSYAPSEPEQRMRVLELSVELLIERFKISDFYGAGFHDAAKLLESVPLATTDFDLAKRRLANSFAYCRQNEFGAAAFELRILRGMLQNL